MKVKQITVEYNDGKPNRIEQDVEVDDFEQGTTIQLSPNSQGDERYLVVPWGSIRQMTVIKAPDA